MGKILVCGHCKVGTEFLGYIKKQAQLKFDGLADVPTVTREGRMESYEVARCLHCKQELTNADLVEMVECTECKTVVPATDIDENGVCLNCVAAKTHPDLLKMSQADLIKMIIQMEKGQGSKSTAINHTIAKAEETNAAAANKPTDEEAAAKRSEAAKKAAATKRRNALIAKGVDPANIDEDGNEITGVAPAADPGDKAEKAGVVAGDLPIDTSEPQKEPIKDWVGEAREDMIRRTAEAAAKREAENTPETQTAAPVEDGGNPIDNLVAPPVVPDDEPF